MARLWRWSGLLLVLVGLVAGLAVGLASEMTTPASITSASVWILPRDADQPATHQQVSLPYGWDYRHPGQSGRLEFLLTFAATPSEPGAWAMFVPRLGNAYQVRLNGVDIEAKGDLLEYDTSDHAKLPRLMTLPTHLLRVENRLQVTLRCDAGRRCGMPAVLVGPRDLVEPAYQREYGLRVGTSALFGAFGLVVALLAGMLWTLQTATPTQSNQGRDPLYLYAAVAELAWGVLVIETLVDNPPLAWPYWATLLNWTLGLWMAALWMVCQQIAGWQHHAWARRARRSLGVLLFLGPLASYYSLIHSWAWLLNTWQLAFGCIYVVSTAIFVRQAFGPVGTMHRIMAGIFLFNVSVGFHDFYVNRIGDIFSRPALLRYTALAFGVALAVIAISRFRAAQRGVNAMLATLSVDIAAKEQALAESYAQLERSARAEGRALERSRILRDMHDGVGSHISTAIRQLQAQPINPHEVLTTLRDSLDQLKLSIDALNLPPGDVAALLANMRYRLEPRVRCMGLELCWQVGDLPILAHLDNEGLRQLQYLCFEAISNVLQHAHAHTLTVLGTPLVAPTSGGILVVIADDGVGFDPHMVEQRGMKGMMQRAQTLGAELVYDSAPGRTRIEIRLPPRNAELQKVSAP